MKLTLDSRFLHKPVTPLNCKGRVAVIFDSDRTLIPREGSLNAREYQEANLRAIAENSERISMASVITGRGNNRIKAFSKPYSVFTPFAFRLSTDTGRGGIFIKEKREEASLWLENFDSRNKCPNWVTHIEQAINWDTYKAVNVLKAVLEKKGFIEKSLKDSTYDSIFHKDDIEIYFVYDQALICIKTTEKKDFDTLISEFLTNGKNSIESALNTKIDPKFGCTHGFIFIDFCPLLPDGRKINKLTISEIILSSMSETQIEALEGVIMLGDSINDEHLKATEFHIPSLKTVPVYSIFSGPELATNNDFNWHPRIRIAEIESNIGETLNQTITEILKL